MIKLFIFIIDKMTMKRCGECGSMYETEDKEVKIKLNHKDIEALEDVFFTKLTEEEFNKIRPRINKVWIQICKEEEKWPENKKI